MSRAASLFSLALLVALAPAADAQSYAAQVRAQLDTAKRTLRNQGFQQSHDYTIESLDDGAEDEFSVDFDEGREYAIVGACDQDCGDMDFWLYDENGNLIDSDTSTDDVPVVRVTPRWSGEFTVRVKMYDCAVEPCFYGIGIYGD